MAITASLIKISVRGVFLGQRVQNVQWYKPEGVAFAAASATDVGEAFWNDIKADWRACHVPDVRDLTTSIFVEEPGSSGSYGEYAIPADEQQGTRDPSGFSSFLPQFNALGVRLTVGTRVTRPGQKRFWGWGEGDSVSGEVQAPAAALAGALAVHFASTLALGAPVAFGSLQAQVVRLDPVTRLPATDQRVLGFVVNSLFTSQNTRKS